jgi:hypothetical protein
MTVPPSWLLSAAIQALIIGVVQAESPIAWQSGKIEEAKARPAAE